MELLWPLWRRAAKPGAASEFPFSRGFSAIRKRVILKVLHRRVQHVSVSDERQFVEQL
jgi:hypothetical protein